MKLAFAMLLSATVALTGCSTTNDRASEPSTTDATAPASASSPSPEATTAEPVDPEPAPETDLTTEEADQALAAEDPTACLQIEFNFEKSWEDKGQSFQSLWLFPGTEMTNNCDKEIASVKYEFTAVDDFGDPWPTFYESQDKIDLQSGATWRQDATWGFQHYDFNENFKLLEDTKARDIKPLVGAISIAFADGTVVEGNRSSGLLE